jgi:hypothetical protein
MNFKEINCRRTTNTNLDAPIEKIVQKLIKKGYAAKNGIPIRNGRFVNHNLHDIVEYYKVLERGILEYYNLASNYSRIAAKVHYILKYSCVLTFASKMKLKTLRKVFKKYGKNLKIKNKHGKIATEYYTVSHKNPN